MFRAGLYTHVSTNDERMLPMQNHYIRNSLPNTWAGVSVAAVVVKQ
jgi:hypothetical protein